MPLTSSARATIGAVPELQPQPGATWSREPVSLHKGVQERGVDEVGIADVDDDEVVCRD